MGCFQSSDADNGGDDEINFEVRGAGYAAGRAPGYFGSGDSLLLEVAGQSCGQFFGGERDQAWAPADGLLKGDLEIAAGGQRGDGVAIGVGFYDREGALADGAGGSEDC